MIYSARYRYIGLQKSDHSYYFLHWSKESGFSKFRKPLSNDGFKPIGPTMLVEWNKE